MGCFRPNGFALFDMADNALGKAMDPLVTITLSVDFATWSGGGTARVRFNQKSAGKAKF